MGTLRTLFAIAVVLTHSLGNLLIGGRNAVQLFYMISGFLISYVLVERKTYPNIRDFYINRYLRLYPIYFFVAFLTLLVFTIEPDIRAGVTFFKTYHEAPYAANILLIFSNITLFLQDWVMFSGVTFNQLVFATDFYKSEVVLYPGLIAPQAWTLGVELTFYLIAPFILFKRRILLSLLALSLSLRIYLIYIGLGIKDPWTYRFFPTELAFFLLGAMAHQVLLPLYKKTLSIDNIEKIARIATYFLVLITLIFSFIPANGGLKTISLFILFFALMPLTFIYQSSREWDKWIGDLSYPIYISHMLVIYVATSVLNKIVIADETLVMGSIVQTNKLLTGISAVVLSICFAIFINKFVGSPIESLRNRFRTINKPTQ